MGYIDGIHDTIYSSTMDPMGIVFYSFYTHTYKQTYSIEYYSITYGYNILIVIVFYSFNGL